MEKGLLIVITIMSTIIMLSSILTTIVICNDSKSKLLIKNILKIMGVILAVAALIGASVAVSQIENESSDNNPVEETTESELSKAGFNEVKLDEYLNLVKGTEKSIVLIARPSCGYCEKFTPILKQAAEEMNLTINYLNTDNLSEDDWTTFTESVTYLKEEEWGTPTVLIVQNGDSIAENSGYVELDVIKKFFTDNGLGE